MLEREVVAVKGFIVACLDLQAAQGQVLRFHKLILERKIVIHTTLDIKILMAKANPLDKALKMKVANKRQICALGVADGIKHHAISTKIPFVLRVDVEEEVMWLRYISLRALKIIVL